MCSRQHIFAAIISAHMDTNCEAAGLRAIAMPTPKGV